jgi:phenylacetate-CoA ligase
MAFSYHWSREEQRKWAEQRLFRYVRRFIDDFHPYYRGLLREQGIDSKRIYSYDDFSGIPVTRRQDLQAGGEAFIMQAGTDGGAFDVKPLAAGARLGYAARAYTTRYLRDVYAPPRSFKERRGQAVMYDWLPAHFTFSQGTTGVPCSAVYTASDMRGIVRRVQGMLYAAGWEPGMRAINLFPALPSLNFLAFAALAGDVSTGGSFLQGCGNGGSGAIPVERQVEMASGLGVEMLISPPGYLLDWLLTAIRLKEQGLIPGLPGIEMVVAGGEPLADGCRKRIKEYLAELGSPEARIMEYYGMTEMKAGFFECDEKMGIHLNPEFFYWEVLDAESAKPVKWGEPGVLVFSHIDWRGTALLRYWTGDFVEGGMVWEKCPSCGLTVPRIFPPIVRAEEDHRDFKGSRLLLPELQRVLHGVEGLESFQAALERAADADAANGAGAPDSERLAVYACAGRGEDEASLRGRIVGALLREMSLSPDEVVFMGPDALRARLFGRTGWRADWVVDEREAALAAEASQPEPVPAGLDEAREDETGNELEPEVASAVEEPRQTDPIVPDR